MIYFNINITPSFTVFAQNHVYFTLSEISAHTTKIKSKNACSQNRRRLVYLLFIITIGHYNVCEHDLFSLP